MELSQLVEKYLAIAGQYGKSVALASLDLPKEQVEKTLSAFDEDYHFSRFFHFACASGAGDSAYQINGFSQTHVSIDPELQSIL